MKVIEPEPKRRDEIFKEFFLKTLDLPLSCLGNFWNFSGLLLSFHVLTRTRKNNNLVKFALVDFKKRQIFQRQGLKEKFLPKGSFTY